MGLDRRTALKRARELFGNGDRRGASKALLEAGFSGSQIEAVFEGFLLEPAKAKEAPRPAPAPAARPAAPPPASPSRPRKEMAPTAGARFIAFIGRRPWVGLAAAGAAVALAAALLLAHPPHVAPPPEATSTAPPLPSAADVSLPDIGSVSLADCRWSDWTGDGAVDGVEAGVRFADRAGRAAEVGLPPGTLLATATVTERVERARFDIVNSTLIPNGTVAETRSLPVSGASVVPSGGGWLLRVSGPAAARSSVSRLDTVSYTLDATVGTSVSAKFKGSCGF